MDAEMQQRISEVASVLVEFYESGDHSRKPILNEQLGDMRSRAGACCGRYRAAGGATSSASVCG